MADRIQVGNRTIGPGAPCFVIAEAGSNHNGSLAQARRLVELAAEAGADAVKFQVFRAARLYARAAGRSDYLRLDRGIYDIIAEMEMPYEWLPELSRLSHERGLAFIATPFDEQSAEKLAPHVDAFKVASYELTHHPLLQHVGRMRKPTILSTGAANLEEVEEAVTAFHATGNDDLALMQCTAAYPAPFESLNIRAIATMKKTFGIPVGLSDHSRDPLLAPLTAVATGADAIEKHYTFSNKLPGPDHGFAIEPHELSAMVRGIRQVEQSLGDGTKRWHPVEEELRRFARRSIFAIRDIEPGEPFTAENVAILRSGKLAPGLPPKEHPRLLGKTAARRVSAESPVQPGDVA